MTKTRAFAMRHWLPASIAVILLFLTVTFTGQARQWYSGITPAIEWQGVEVMTQTVQPGGILKVTYTAVINKACPADLRTFIVAPDGSVPVRFPIIAGGYNKPTNGHPVHIQVSVSIPPAADPGLSPLQSGPHTYRTIATRYCPDGIEDDTHIPDAKFQLEAAK